MQTFYLIACIYAITLYYPIKEIFTGYWLRDWNNGQRHKQYVKNKKEKTS